MEKPRSRDGIDPVGRSKSSADFAARLRALAAEHVPGVAIGCDDEILTAPASPLWQRVRVFGREINVRLAAHPTEGWDAFGEADDGIEGMPSPWTLNRWTGFGLSGMQLLLGGEAYAVVRAAKANPHQLFYSDAGKAGPEQLRAAALRSRLAAFRDDKLVIGLQLTHSGLYCCPDFGRGMQPMPAVWHPVLGPRFGATPEMVVSDAYLDDLLGHFVRAAKLAHEAGFDFVDVKHCHGYLLHQLLGAHTRDGHYGGSFENRTRFLREVVRAIRSECPGLGIMVRLSVFDHAPILRSGETVTDGYRPDHYMFGVAEDGAWASNEVHEFL
ncbi:MAG: hypothetical protein KDD69_19465, partial [Bdellovibrionales bacterium]|nr:hypothetical protein [Bdellovibrionales bacterium]